MTCRMMIPWRKFRYLQIPNIWQFGSINHQCYSTRQGISRLVCHLSIATYSNQESASPWPQHSNHHQRHHACQQHPTMYLRPSHIDTVVGTIKTLSVSIGQFQFLPEKAWQTSTNIGCGQGTTFAPVFSIRSRSPCACWECYPLD